MSTASKTVIYTGAPQSKLLQWDEDHLTALLQPSFSNNVSNRHFTASSTTEQGPNWRYLPPNRSHLPTGLTQATNPDFRPLSPTQKSQNHDLPPSSALSESRSHETTYASLSEDLDDEEARSQYYEHSFAIHEDVPSSQVLPPSTAALPSQTQSQAESSFLSTSYASSDADSTNYSILSTNLAPHHDVLDRIAITDLKDLPNAAYLRNIEPQTMTVNLLVGIISIPAPRIIRTRRGNRTVELIEMIVGDETKAGVGINVWLSHHTHSHIRPPHREAQTMVQLELEKQMEGLRPQDVVLMKNVALTSFRGRVYGQSLRRGMTKMELLYRINGVDGDEPRGLFGLRELERAEGMGVEKVRRVREWCLHFVGGVRNGGHGARGVEEKGEEGRVGRVAGRGRGDELPADTQ
ncbi:MAG: hypothetical protein Q9218_005108 [Villophora microphyllina]